MRQCAELPMDINRQLQQPEFVAVRNYGNAAPILANH